MSATHYELVALVRDYVGTKAVISGDTRLYHNLFIGGDDACELIDDVQSRYGTNFDGFAFRRHFPDEMECAAYGIGGLLGFRAKNLRPFTVGHLQAVVVGGKWFDPPDEDVAFSLQVPTRPRQI